MQASPHISTWRRLAVEQRSSALKRMQGARILSTPRSSRTLKGNSELSWERGDVPCHFANPHILRRLLSGTLVIQGNNVWAIYWDKQARYLRDARLGEEHGSASEGGPRTPSPYFANVRKIDP